MVDKFINMWKVRELADKVTNVVMNYTEIEGKVREATNDDPWGPTGPLMQELAHATFSYESFPEVMSMLWKRMLQDNKTNWRRTYKVRELIDFIQDDERLREERKKAKKNKDKYIGMSSDAMGMRGISSGGYNDSGWKTTRSDHGENWYSDSRPGDRYEYDDDAHYEGEKEFSDSDSPSPRRSYRYNDRASPAEIVNESKTSNSINMSIRPKSANASIGGSGTVTKQPHPKIPVGSKKIDMGAAANFGKTPATTTAGIHSPTHRDTPTAESNDLIGYTVINNNNNNTQQSNSNSNNNNNNNNNTVSELFKTCAPSVRSETTLNSAAVIEDDLDDFNPRAAESAQTEFGDFAAAFGAANSATTNEPPSAGLSGSNANTTDDFADFSAFQSNSSSAAGAHQSNTGIIGGLDGNLLTTTTPANDAFDLFNSTNATSTTATDLLAGLGDLSIHQSMPMAKDKDNQEKEQIFPPHLRAKLKQAITQLQSLIEVQSSNDICGIKEIIKDLLSDPAALPGYTTLEKLCDLDKDEIKWQMIVHKEYNDLLNSICQLFNRYWPPKELTSNDKYILNIFKIDYNFNFIYENFTCLIIKLDKLPETIVIVLEYLINDDELLAISFLHICKERAILLEKYKDNNNKNITEQTKLQEFEENVTNYLQLLISLPNRIANQLLGKMSSIFTPICYGKILMQHFLKALWFLVHLEEFKEDDNFNLQFLTDLLNRIVYDLCTDSPEDANILLLFQILEEMAKRPLCGRIIQLILINISNRYSTTAYRLALIMLKNKINIYLLLGPIIQYDNTWQLCFMHKLTLQRIPETNQALLSLVQYIARVDEQMLKRLFKLLLDTWSKRIVLQKLSHKEHFSLSKLLLLAAKKLYDLKENGKFTPIDETDIKRQLHEGLRNHLECADHKQRYIGMKVVESIFNWLTTTDPEIKEEDLLKFDYNSIMGSSTGELIQELDKLLEKSDSFNEEEIHFKPQRLEELLKEFLETKAKFTIESKTPSSNKITEVSSSCSSPKLPSPLFALPSASPSTSKSDCMLSNLDSDDDEEDDLQAYDMSNDIPQYLEKRPKFLLDLLSTLSTKCENYEIFSATLSTAESLIRTQLPFSDTSMALDLMAIFINLDMQFFYENFEETKFKCCVAICVSHPAACAEYICREFHKDNSHYNANLRIIMLQILSQATKELCGAIAIADENASSIEVIKPIRNWKPEIRKFTFANEHRERLLEARKIIRQRLREKTKRYCSKSAKTKDKAKPNRFHSVVGTFFFCLVRGQRTKEMLYTKYDRFAHDIDTMLLINFMHTLSIIVMGAENSPLISSIAREVFDLCSFTRFSPETSVRLVTLELLGITLTATPDYLMLEQLNDRLMELKYWLEDFIQSPLIGGEKSEECREIATQILSTYNILSASQSIVGNNDNLLQPISSTNNNIGQEEFSIKLNNKIGNGSNQSLTQVGATWSDNLKAGNLKIDLDNLLTNKSGKSNNIPAPSMNALKVQSPSKTSASPLSVQTTPHMGGQLNAFTLPPSSSSSSSVISPAMSSKVVSSTFFNTASSHSNIPDQRQQRQKQQQQQQHQQAFANINAMQQQQQKDIINNNKNNNSNNLQTQSFDLFQ
uniref:ENTH domain-containing protein n=1 Tax=Glossina brevipalpis TaxID=37001 RepID=A0A1A9WNM1_9MUSC